MKNSSIENRFCMSLVAFAVIVRLLLATGAAAAVDEAFGRAPQAQAPEPDILTLEILAAPEPIVPPEPQPEAEPEPASEPEPEPTYTPPVFSAEEADGIRIAGACSYTPDKQTLLLQPSSLDFQQDGPTVLIVHTHSSEAYTMEAGFEYPESDELRTQDSRYSVIRIGDEIAQILQDAGIEVLHDTEPNDYPNYNGAYERMRQTIEGYLAAYPTIQMVLDLHRDAAEDAGGVPVALTAYPDGEACAELMLVVGTDEGGLPHPDWQENLANALKLQALLNRSAPGLCRDLDLRTERFNQHETPGSLLVEVGASGNTLAEALRSARILANALEIFAEHLGELGSVLRLFVSGLFPVQADLRIALAVGDAGHAQVHADLGAFAAEVGLQLVEDILLVRLGDVGVVLDGLGVDAVLMLGRQGQLALDFLEHVAFGMTDGAFCRSSVAFVDVATDFADKFLHDDFLRKCCFVFVLVDGDYCVSFFMQAAQTPLTAMRQVSTLAPVCCSTSCRVSAGSSSQLMSLTAPQTRQMKCACGSVRKSNRSSPLYTPTESMVPSALNMARLR